MSKIIEISDSTKVLWGTTVRQEYVGTDFFPEIPEGIYEPIQQVKELSALVEKLQGWAVDFTPKTELVPVVASSWISEFTNSENRGMKIHTDEDHGGTISCVCWFEGEEGCGGDLVLWDPRWENPKLWGGVKGDGKYTIPFKPGTIVMFPSSVWHEVTPYTGSQSRRSINIVLTYRNVKDVALDDLCQDELIEIANKLGVKYSSSNESFFSLLQAIKKII